MASRSATDSARPPVFVVLDGVDGCGKTTQAGLLAERLAEDAVSGAEPLHLREPGSTPAGERIRELVLDPSAPLGRAALALLFTAARRQTLESLVAPALAQGRDVVIERFHASTFAYQGSGGATEGPGVEFGEDELLDLLHGWAGAPRPSVEIVLDVSPEDAFARAMARDGGGGDRFESRGVAFQQAVSAAMRRYVERVPHAVLVDGRGDPESVAARVHQAALGGGLQHG